MNIKKKEVFGGNVISCLKSKKKRSALVLFDCCNSYPEKRMQDIRGQSFFLKKSDDLKGFCKLLLSFRGIASSAAAEAGEYATCTPSWGGTFSQGFLRSVQQLGADEAVSWDKIFKLTTFTTAKIAEEVFHCDQHPIYSIEQS
jgi:hypothetical protein